MSAYYASSSDIAAKSSIGVTSGKPERIAKSSLSDGMSAEQIAVVNVTLCDKPLRTWRQHRRRQLTGPALQIQAVIHRAVFIPHSKVDIRIPKCLQSVECENVARLINVAEGGHDLARRIDRQAS